MAYNATSTERTTDEHQTADKSETFEKFVGNLRKNFDEITNKLNSYKVSQFSNLSGEFLDKRIAVEKLIVESNLSSRFTFCNRNREWRYCELSIMYHLLGAIYNIYLKEFPSYFSLASI